MALGAAFCLSLVTPFTAKAVNKSKALQEALKANYDLARTGIDQVRITKPGTVLVIRKNGVYANPSIDFGTLTTKVVDGKVQQPKGFGAAFFSNQKDRTLKAGTTVYVEHIGVRRNEVRFLIITCDTSEVNVKGNTRNIRYKATVAFKFPQGFLDNADAGAVEKAIGSVLLPQDEVQAAQTKTVELGQTPKQVRSALGAPSKIIKLGPKEIFVYKDMKVVFMNGKVSDVE